MSPAPDCPMSRVAFVVLVCLLSGPALASAEADSNGLAVTFRHAANLGASAGARETAHVSALRRIVIDPGHGGRNEGAIGVGHVHEKHLTLPIAMHLADRLRVRHPELEIILTREADVELGLSDRAEVANAHDADLFISIHLNAAGNPEAVG